MEKFIDKIAAYSVESSPAITESPHNLTGTSEEILPKSNNLGDEDEEDNPNGQDEV